MNHREISSLMASIAPTIGDFVSKAMEPLRAENARLSTRLAAFETRFDELPKPQGPDEILILRLVQEEVAKIPPAMPGKDADPVLIADLVAKAVAELPAAKDGEPGAPGKDGEPGAPGVAGQDGKDGEPGAPGIDGKDGAVGERGEKGIDGERGQDGKDADPQQVQDLVTQAVTRAVTEKVPVKLLVNDKGSLVAMFSDGQSHELGRVRGASVMDGKIGDDGILTLRMSDGREVQAGIARGKDGKDGEPGVGRPGRDALEIQIVAGIDESRSYADGVCARYRGGVIRAERQTDAIVDGDIKSAGWSAILDGIFEETEEVVGDGRFVERTTTYTSGNVFRRKLKTYAVVERGVWREGENYTKGDAVTWGGQFFIAQRDEPADKPGTSSQWRLAVKKGRDGKDATAAGAKGPVTARVPNGGDAR